MKKWIKILTVTFLLYVAIGTALTLIYVWPNTKEAYEIKSESGISLSPGCCIRKRVNFTDFISRPSTYSSVIMWPGILKKVGTTNNN